MERERTERQTDQEEIKSPSRSALSSFLWVWLFGLWKALERGMAERNEGGMKAQGRPLGGRSDRTDSPSRKLIIENMGKSYYCGCNWGMEKISRLFQFECQRGNHSGLWEKRGATHYRLQTEYSSLPQNHYTHMCANTLHTLTYYCERGCLVELLLAAKDF